MQGSSPQLLAGYKAQNMDYVKTRGMGSHKLMPFRHKERDFAQSCFLSYCAQANQGKIRSWVPVFWILCVKPKINNLHRIIECPELNDAVAIIQLRFRYCDFKALSFANLLCGLGISICISDGSALSKVSCCINQSSVQEFAYNNLFPLKSMGPLGLIKNKHILNAFL